MVEFFGKWTAELADCFPPLEGMPRDKFRYVCYAGYLLITPRDPAVARIAERLADYLVDPLGSVGYFLAVPLDPGVE